MEILKKIESIQTTEVITQIKEYNLEELNKKKENILGQITHNEIQIINFNAAIDNLKSLNLSLLNEISSIDYLVDQFNVLEIDQMLDTKDTLMDGKLQIM